MNEAQTVRAASSATGRSATVRFFSGRLGFRLLDFCYLCFLFFLALVSPQPKI